MHVGPCSGRRSTARASHARSSVRLLETRSCTWTTELLGLAAAGISDKQGLVVLDEEFLQLTLHLLVIVLLGVRDDGLGDGLTDGEDLRAGTTTADTHADVQVLEASGSEEEEGLHNFQSHRDRLHNVQRLSIDTNISSAGRARGNSRRVLLSSEGLHLLEFLVRHLFFVRYSVLSYF